MTSGGACMPTLSWASNYLKHSAPSSKRSPGWTSRFSTGTGTTSVVAVLEGGQPGPTTLLRGDMDALPMPEDTGLAFSSTVDGTMHACGHDAHVAMLAGAAHLLSKRKNDVAGRVVFMFQPGEEGHGGAKVMLREGVLDKHGTIDRAFAIHVYPVRPSGWVYTRGGPVMASSDDFRVTVRGSGGHASMPADAIDPVPVACELVTTLQTMVTRRIPVFDPTVLTVTRISAGTTFNVIPETAVIEGTVRTISAATRALVFENLRRVVEHVVAAHLCQAELETTFFGRGQRPSGRLPGHRERQFRGAAHSGRGPVIGWGRPRHRDAEPHDGCRGLVVCIGEGPWVDGLSRCRPARCGAAGPQPLEPDAH